MTIPHVTNHDDADITDLEAFRVATNKENEKSGVKVTMLAFLIKACVAALQKFPDFNASLDGDAARPEEVLPHRLRRRHAQRPGRSGDPRRDKKGVLQISTEMGELAKKARDGKLTPGDMSGGCFSISSLGGIGGRYFTPIINAPEVAILGVCRSTTEPVWDGKAFQPRLDAAALAQLGPPRRRRRDGGALQRLPDPGARRLPAGAAVTVDVKVPDIGDFKDVGVIEVLVKPGDTVQVEQSLITIESDKASMEIPSSHAGVVKELKVKVGDTVNQGSVILSLEAAQGAAAPGTGPRPRRRPLPAAPAPAARRAPRQRRAPAPAPARSAAPAVAAASSFGGDLTCDLLVLGAGPGGYSAAFRAADLGLKVVMVERYATLGGVCLNVGCIPSKAMLHVAAVIDEVAHFGALGVEFGAPTVDAAKLVAHKNKVVGRLTGGLAQMAKMRKVTVVTGSGRFSDDHHVVVDLAAGGTTTIGFARAVIAAGSRGRRSCPSCRRTTRASSPRPARSSCRRGPSAC